VLMILGLMSVSSLNSRLHTTHHGQSLCYTQMQWVTQHDLAQYCCTHVKTKLHFNLS